MTLAIGETTFFLPISWYFFMVADLTKWSYINSGAFGCILGLWKRGSRSDCNDAFSDAEKLV